MNGIEWHSADVIVIGTGLGGLRAAGEAALAGAKTLLVSAGPFGSGSSFCPWTWGLGMIAPKDDGDRDGLLAAVGRVGLGLNRPELTRILVDRVDSEIERLRGLGVPLKPQVEPRGVVPCFDSSPRKWVGFDGQASRKAFETMLGDPRLDVLDRTSVLALASAGPEGKAALCAGRDGGLFAVSARAIVIASGGFTSAWDYSYQADAGLLPLHAEAARLGCRMENLEFVQFIVGHLAPAANTIFNERAFSKVRMEASDGRPLFAGSGAAELLAARSAHGPFTTRLPTMAVDEAIHRHRLERGVAAAAVYPADIGSEPDSLLRHYFEWFRERFGGTFPPRIGIVHHAHACNGGISIGRDADAGVPGVFACGEVSGGVHGADRIGGLSTGNALVFGAIAGRNAALYALGLRGRPAASGTARSPGSPVTPRASPAAVVPATLREELAERMARWASPKPSRPRGTDAESAADSRAEACLGELRIAFGLHAGIERVEAGMKALSAIADRCEASMIDERPGPVAGERLSAYLGLTRMFVAAMRARPRPAGCHNFVPEA